MSDLIRVKELLAELVDIEGSAGWDLAKWNNHAEKIFIFMKSTNVELPEIVWHYLSDADIRFKEEEYGTEQLESVREFLNNE